jgi:hypothetical protein
MKTDIEANAGCRDDGNENGFILEFGNRKIP